MIWTVLYRSKPIEADLQSRSHIRLARLLELECVRTLRPKLRSGVKDRCSCISGGMTVSRGCHGSTSRSRLRLRGMQQSKTLSGAGSGHS